VNIRWERLCAAGQAFIDLDKSMAIHEKSVDMDMDVKYHSHSNPANVAFDPIALTFYCVWVSSSLLSFWEVHRRVLTISTFSDSM
jgi:hypothetical protein